MFNNPIVFIDSYGLRGVQGLGPEEKEINEAIKTMRAKSVIAETIINYLEKSDLKTLIRIAIVKDRPGYDVVGKTSHPGGTRPRTIVIVVEQVNCLDVLANELGNAFILALERSFGYKPFQLIPWELQEVGSDRIEEAIMNELH